MKKIPLSPFLPLLFGLVVSTISPATLLAQTAAWGTSSSIYEPGGRPQLFLPDGTPMPEGYQWEVGWFDAGFIPTMANATQWAAAWHSVGSALVSGAPDWSVSGHVLDVGIAAAGKQGWMWAFSNKAQMGQPGATAVLITSPACVFPGTLDVTTFDVAQIPDRLNDNMRVVMGRVDRNLLGLGGVQCGGVIPFPKQDSASPDYQSVTFEVQAATWPAVGQLYASDWLATHFTATERANNQIGTWTADPDKDGLNNLLEYAYGLDPKVASRRRAVTVASTAQGVELSLQLSSQALVKVEVFESPDLLQWTPSNPLVINAQPNYLARVAPAVAGGHRFYTFRISPIE